MRQTLDKRLQQPEETHLYGAVVLCCAVVIDDTNENTDDLRCIYLTKWFIRHQIPAIAKCLGPGTGSPAPTSDCQCPEAIPNPALTSGFCEADGQAAERVPGMLLTHHAMPLLVLGIRKSSFNHSGSQAFKLKRQLAEVFLLADNMSCASV